MLTFGNLGTVKTSENGSEDKHGILVLTHKIFFSVVKQKSLLGVIQKYFTAATRGLKSRSIKAAHYISVSSSVMGTVCTCVKTKHDEGQMSDCVLMYFTL